MSAMPLSDHNTKVMKLYWLVTELVFVAVYQAEAVRTPRPHRSVNEFLCHFCYQENTVLIIVIVIVLLAILFFNALSS